MAVLPRRVHRRIAVEPELCDISLVHAMKARVIVVSESREVVETVGPDRTPGAIQLEHKDALRRLEAKPRDRRRGLREFVVFRMPQRDTAEKGREVIAP